MKRILHRKCSVVKSSKHRKIEIADDTVYEVQEWVPDVIQNTERECGEWKTMTYPTNSINELAPARFQNLELARRFMKGEFGIYSEEVVELNDC